MRVLMRERSPRPGYLQSMDGQPMTLRQLALATSCPTADVRPLLEELTAAGVCGYSEKEGYFSPRIVQFQAFREKCAKAGRRGGGNPKLRRPTFKGRPKGCPKRSPKGSSPDGSSPLIPLSSFPSPGIQEEEEAEARARGGDAAAAKRLEAARTFAADWIAKNMPGEHAGVRPFAKLVERLGLDLAVEEVRTAALDPSVQNPFAVAWSNHDPRRSASRNGNGSHPAPKTFDQISREQQSTAISAGLSEVIGDR